MKQAKLKHVLTKISLKIFLSTLFMLFTITIFSQVKGIIKDASNGEPLIGA